MKLMEKIVQDLLGMTFLGSGTSKLAGSSEMIDAQKPRPTDAERTVRVL